MQARLSVPALLLLAACGGDGGRVTIRGDFAPGQPAPNTVLAEEAGAEAAVSGGAFELGGLVAAPVTLRLGAEEEGAVRVEIPDLPPGASLTLHGLRVDEATSRAFPASIELEGARSVRVNGIRMAPADRLPERVDAAGAVLAVSDEREALLFRPDDADLPDLRVVVGLATETVTEDGDPVEPGVLTAGDSLRVEGTVDRGFVLAQRLVLPRRTATRNVALDGGSDEAPREGERGGGGGGEPERADNGGGGEASRDGGGGSPAVAAPAPRPVVARPRGNGNGNGKARGQERGGGRGNGRGGGKKPKG